MKEGLVKLKVEKSIAKNILKGEGINKYCISNIACGNFSIEFIADEIIKDKKHNKMFKNRSEAIVYIADIILKKRNLDDIVRLARCVPIVPIDKITDFVIRTKDMKKIYNFINSVENAPIDKFIDQIASIEISPENSFYLKSIYIICVKRNIKERTVILKKLIEFDGNQFTYLSDKTIIELAMKANKEDIAYFVDPIIQTKWPYAICDFAEKKQNLLNEEQINKLAKAIIEEKNISSICTFNERVENAPKQMIFDALIELKSPKAVNFPKELIEESEENIKKLAEIVIENGYRTETYIFNRMFNNVYVDRFTDLIIAEKDVYPILTFASIAKGADIEKLYKAIFECINIKSKIDRDALYKFITNFKVKNINRAINVLIKGKDYEHIIEIVKTFKNVPIAKIQKAIVNSKKPEYILKFAKEVKEADIDLLAEAICKTGSAAYIYEFAKEIKNAPIEKLEDAIIKTKQMDYIYKFADTIKRANKQKLVKIITY